MDKEILELKLREIDLIIKEQYKKEKQIGVLAGVSGASLFQFYYSKYLSIDDHSNIGMEILEYLMDKINKGYNYPTFCSGIAGAGWVLDHLEQENFIDIDNDDLLLEFDNYLHSAMISDMNNGNYDFLHGAIGYAFYFLNRYRNTKSDKLKKKYKLILLEFIEYLKNLSEEDGDNKIKWLWTADYDSFTNTKSYNLGLSHGMSSIVGILTKLCQHYDFKEKSEIMLRNSVNYILSFERKDENNISLFPSWVPKNSEVNYDTRLAWCYGDLGIGIRFWHASKVLNDKNLGHIAIDIMKRAAKRTTPESSKVIDAGICHGSYGNAQIFYRMFKETNDVIFKDAVTFWIKDGIEKAVYEDGFAGYKQWKGEDKPWESSISLLEGVAGIGLTIIDYLADFETNWDECLMIS